MHSNSIIAYYEELIEGRLNNRCKTIIQALSEISSGTDRDVLKHVGLPDMNNVRPRITDMIKAGIIEEVCKRKDEITGKTVRVVRLVPMKAKTRQMELVL